MNLIATFCSALALTPGSPAECLRATIAMPTQAACETAVTNLETTGAAVAFAEALGVFAPAGADPGEVVVYCEGVKYVGAITPAPAP
jgi:hypothetical protein